MKFFYESGNDMWWDAEKILSVVIRDRERPLLQAIFIDRTVLQVKDDDAVELLKLLGIEI